MIDFYQQDRARYLGATKREGIETCAKQNYLGGTPLECGQESLFGKSVPEGKNRRIPDEGLAGPAA